MGSFHTTCNISQLPITPGTPVRILFLGKSPYRMDPKNPLALGEGGNSREGCYSTDFWYPRMVPLKATYYDYGQVQDVEHGLGQLLFWEQLRTDLWSVEQGENEYHQPASAFNMDWEQMWWVAIEGRLRIKRKYVSREDSHLAVPVCPVMIREDVWQAMLVLTNPNDAYELVDGKYETKPLRLEFFKEQILRAFQKVMADPMSDWERKYNEEHPGTTPSRFYLGFQGLFLDHNNPAGALGLEFYLRSLIEAVEAGEYTLESPEIQDMIHRIAEVMHVKYLYSALRRTWHPGTGQGSQSTEYLTQAKFHHAMAAISYHATDLDNKRRSEWDPEEDENGNIIPVKPAERMNMDTFIEALSLPQEEA